MLPPPPHDTPLLCQALGVVSSSRTRSEIFPLLPLAQATHHPVPQSSLSHPQTAPAISRPAPTGDGEISWASDTIILGLRIADSEIHSKVKIGLGQDSSLGHPIFLTCYGRLNKFSLKLQQKVIFIYNEWLNSHTAFFSLGWFISE